MLKVGVIGYGYWGPNLVRNFVENPGCLVIAVCDQNPARLELVKRRYPHVNILQSALELIEHPEIEAIVVATPASTHFDLGMQALIAGKHVLIEKPLTETAEQAEILVSEARKRNLIIMVDHTFVYTPALQHVRKLIDKGELGDIYYYDSVRANLGLFQQDINVIHDLAVHDFSILSYLFDFKIKSIAASAMSHIGNKTENMAFVTLCAEENFIAHVNVNWLSPVKIRRIMIGGAKKMVVYDDIESAEKIRLYDAGVELDKKSLKNNAKFLYRMGDVVIPNLPALEALGEVVEHFRMCVELNKTPVTDGEFGLKVVRLLDAATKSVAAGGKPIYFE